MRRVTPFLLLAALGLLIALPVGAQARPAVVKAFAPGCWKGKGQGDIVGISSPAPGITLNVDSSGYKFVLKVTKKTAAGTLDLSGHGTATATAGGITATADLTVSGNLALSGKPAHVAINGDVKANGTVSVAGVTVPVDYSFTASAVPMTIKTAAPKKVTGRAGKSSWTAVRVGKTCS